MSSEPADTATQTRPGVATREVRVLEGPNLYFPRPAVKVTLALPGYLDAPDDALRAVATAAGLRRGQPGAPGSEQRQQVLLRLVERVARAAGRRGRAPAGSACAPGPANETDVVVCAFVWRHRARAEALGEAIGLVLADLLAGRAFPDAVADRAAAVAAAPRSATAPGWSPRASRSPRSPAPTARRRPPACSAHICMTAGLRTGWSSTDGVVVQGEVIEPGDYSGPAGARAVLEAPGVQIGILETARGGMLLRGHGRHPQRRLGGHQRLGRPPRACRASTPSTSSPRSRRSSPGSPSPQRLGRAQRRGPAGLGDAGRHPGPAVGLHRRRRARRPCASRSAPGGRAMTVLDGHLTVLQPDAAPDRLVRVVDLPMALSGLSHHNVLNALAGAAAALGLGIDRAAVVEGLRTFRPDDVLNPGRMNTYTAAGRAAATSPSSSTWPTTRPGSRRCSTSPAGWCAPGGRVHLALGHRRRPHRRDPPGARRDRRAAGRPRRGRPQGALPARAHAGGPRGPAAHRAGPRRRRRHRVVPHRAVRAAGAGRGRRRR